MGKEKLINVNVNISEKCAGCGMCYSTYPDYFNELSDGKAGAISEYAILSNETVEEMKNTCPYGAIIIEEEKKATKQDILSMIEKLKEYTLSYPKSDMFKFDEKEYGIAIPVAMGEYRYDYTSEETANRAAEREFDSKMYSQIDAIILKIITEYRVKYLKPFCTKLEEEKSYFFNANQEVMQLLRKLENMLNNNLVHDIPINFARVDIYPEKDVYWKMLVKGEIMSDEMISAIRREFMSGSYSDLSSYNSYWDIDEMEKYAGTDRKGNIKTKDYYCYKNMNGAFQELAKDLLNSFNYAGDKLEERAMEITKGLVDEYNKLLRLHLADKLAYLNSKLDKFEDGKKQAELPQYDNATRRVGHKDSRFYLNGETIEDPDLSEIFIIESKDIQYYYDGKNIKKWYVKNGLIHREAMFTDKNFDYGEICGYNNCILFVDWNHNQTIYVYDTIKEVLNSIDRNMHRYKIVNNIYIYTSLDNLDDIRNSSGRLCCCSLDGTNKRTLYRQFREGMFFLDNVTDTEITFTTMQNNTKRTVVWN